MNQLFLGLALSLALLCSGCFHHTTGQPIDPNNVQSIEKGKTTESQLVQMFGEPTTWYDHGDGSRDLVWNYNQSMSDITSLSDSNKLDRLTVTLRGGVVESYKYLPHGGKASGGKYVPQAPATQKSGG